LPAVTKDDWLLVFHVFGAFLFLSGAVGIAVFSLAAVRRERPSEIALLFRLGRVAEHAVNVGAVVALGFGIWLVEDLPYYKLSDGWIVAALVLWALSGALGGAGGARYKRAREEASGSRQRATRPHPSCGHSSKTAARSCSAGRAGWPSWRS
jgi:uncharacterized membrane protein